MVELCLSLATSLSFRCVMVCCRHKNSHLYCMTQLPAGYGYQRHIVVGGWGVMVITDVTSKNLLMTGRYRHIRGLTSLTTNTSVPPMVTRIKWYPLIASPRLLSAS